MTLKEVLTASHAEKLGLRGRLGNKLLLQLDTRVAAGDKRYI